MSAEEPNENNMATDIASTAIQLECMSVLDRQKIILHLKGYVDGYSKCWNDVQKILDPILNEDTKLGLSGIAAEAKLKLRNRYATLQEEVERLGHAEEQRDKGRDGTDPTDDSVPATETEQQSE